MNTVGGDSVLQSHQGLGTDTPGNTALAGSNDQEQNQAGKGGDHAR